MLAEMAGAIAGAEETGKHQQHQRRTTQPDIQDAITHPGAVRINVQGAFIVDDDPTTPQSDDYEHDTKDIRLPNHTAVVSHIAIDVIFMSLVQIPEACFLTRSPDWWFSSEASVLLTRAAVQGSRWQTQLPQIRDGQNRHMHRVHATPAS